MWIFCGGTTILWPQIHQNTRRFLGQRAIEAWINSIHISITTKFSKKTVLFWVGGDDSPSWKYHCMRQNCLFSVTKGNVLGLSRAISMRYVYGLFIQVRKEVPYKCHCLCKIPAPFNISSSFSVWKIIWPSQKSKLVGLCSPVLSGFVCKQSKKFILVSFQKKPCSRFCSSFEFLTFFNAPFCKHCHEVLSHYLRVLP